MARVKVRIKGAEVRVEVQGVMGPQCQKLTEDLINSLGAATESQLTEEAYMGAEVTLTQTASAG